MGWSERPRAAQHCSSAVVWFWVRLPVICLTHYKDAEVSSRETNTNIMFVSIHPVSTHEEASNMVTYCRAGCQAMDATTNYVEDLAGRVMNELLKGIQNTTFVCCIHTYIHIYYTYTHTV